MTKRLACLRNWWYHELAKRPRGRVSLLGWCQGNYAKKRYQLAIVLLLSCFSLIWQTEGLVELLSVSTMSGRFVRGRLLILPFRIKRALRH